MMIGRNAPCPCGSGRKFKQCCGRLDTVSLSGLHPGVTRLSPVSLQTAIEHFQNGRISQSAACLQSILAADPGQADALHLLGIISLQRGDGAAALDLITKAVGANPAEPIYCNSLGNILQDRGRPDEAVTCYRQALSLKPDYAEAHSNLGAALLALGRNDEAVDSLQSALAIKPDYVEALSHLGNAFQARSRMDEAIACYRQALTIKPDQADCLSNLGIALHGKGLLEEAAACCRQALSVDPNHVNAITNLGNVLQSQGALSESIHCYRQALSIKPEHLEALNNLGNVFKDQGLLDEAIDCYRKTLLLNPDQNDAHSNLLFCLNYHPHLSPAKIYSEHLAWGERQVRRKIVIQRRLAELNPERRLRVGYVSPDLRQHSVAYFFEPLLREHDRRLVEIFCYAEVLRPDRTTARFQGLADHWLSTVGLTDEEFARRIVDDGIDILIDLAGHTENNRLPVFALKPAPIQVNWLGYPHGTGLRTMDYRLVDSVTDPGSESETYASETLVRLDHGFLCYEPPPEAPFPSNPPCLDKGVITFASFNNPAKLSSVTLDAWANLLARVQNARLLLKGKMFADAGSSAQFLDRLKQRGIAADRVTLMGSVASQADHLSLYGMADIALDPFPYNGTTTTCEALWMGVPVVCLRGERHAARVGASLLTQIGMTELIASGVQDYLDIAAELAGNQQKLSALRHSLRARMTASSLYRSADFARKMEEAYRRMWRLFCAGGQ